jgi:sigma-B regulation protein RsbU (phosphoserine phosphatase)
MNHEELMTPESPQMDVELPRPFSNAETFVNNMAEQLLMAGQVQRDFLPKSLPNTDKVRWSSLFLPAQVVSGDMFDVARIDETHIGFYIADVVGHGIPAALLTVFFKQAIVMRETLSNAYRIFSPQEVLTNLNLKITELKLTANQFVTCCYCLLNTETLEVTFARGGHPYPVLIRGNQQPVQLQTPGPLVGVFEHAIFPEMIIQLQKGDKFLLYSDGAERFIGQFNDDTGFHFDARFCQTKDLPIAAMVDEFNINIQSQHIEYAEIDDITVVGLEIL